MSTDDDVVLGPEVLLLAVRQRCVEVETAGVVHGVGLRPQVDPRGGEAVVAVHRLPGRRRVGRVARADGHAHHGRLDAHPVRGRAELRQGLLVGERLAVVLARRAAARRLPLLRGVGLLDLRALDQRAPVGSGVVDHLPGVGRVVDLQRHDLLALAARVGHLLRRPCRVARRGHVEPDRHVRDARLVALGHGVGRVELVAGGVVGDRADDPAVGARVVGLHAPVDLATEADDRQEVDVDEAAELRGRLGLVLALVGHAGGLVPGVEGLQDEPLAERVGLADVVGAVAVGGGGVGVLVHQRVVALADGQRELGDRLLTRVLLAVAVAVDEDGAVHVGEPADDHLVADVGHPAVLHLDVEAPQDVVLVVVPDGQLVGAVRRRS